jgi:4,5-DOPA dioxygenase extradiol
MRRRDALRLLATVPLAPLGAAAACNRPRAGATSIAPGAATAMPVLFLAHGSPQLLDDARWVDELARWAGALPRPSAVLMVSAHWESRPVAVGATRTVPLLHDFYGFPARYYQVTYPAPGAPGLAARVRALVAGDAGAAAAGPVAEDPRRGLDHGAYVPLLAMYPRADVPVLQLSLPTLEPRLLFALGRALAPLRDEGVLVVGSGFLSHNLRAADPGPAPQTPAWAAEFDAWAAEALARKDVDAVLDYRRRAPGVQLALPTHEHFVPLVVALGAASRAPADVRFPITGFLAGSLTRRSVQFG